MKISSFPVLSAAELERAYQLALEYRRTLAGRDGLQLRDLSDHGWLCAVVLPTLLQELMARNSDVDADGKAAEGNGQGKAGDDEAGALEPSFEFVLPKDAVGAVRLPPGNPLAEFLRGHGAKAVWVIGFHGERQAVVSVHGGQGR